MVTQFGKLEPPNTGQEAKGKERKTPKVEREEKRRKEEIKEGKTNLLATKLCNTYFLPSTSTSLFMLISLYTSWQARPYITPPTSSLSYTWSFLTPWSSLIFSCLETLSHPKALSHVWSSHMPLTPLKLFHTHCHLVSHDINAFPSFTLSFFFNTNFNPFWCLTSCFTQCQWFKQLYEFFIVYYVYIWYLGIFEPFVFLVGMAIV